MYNFTRLKDCVVTNKNVIVRVDINVPMKNGEIEDDTRIRAIIPTLKYLVENRAKIIIISHFGRPKGKMVKEMSLAYLVKRIQELLNGVRIEFVEDCISDEVNQVISSVDYGEIILLENLRFYEGETKNSQDFARKLASFGNLYVNDAFSCSHRSHASIVGIPSILKGCAGLLLESEIDNLQKLVSNPKKPMMAIVGGSKISTKIDLLNALTIKADAIVIGGGMANTFLYALGNDIGISLYEKDLKDTALQIYQKAQENNCKIILPKDVLVCKRLKNNANAINVNIGDVKEDDIIADIGQQTAHDISLDLKNYKTVVWNGPLGAFEFKPFDSATNHIAKAVCNLTKENKLISVAGGGDIVSALNSSGSIDGFTYISTAGGAFLEWLEGKGLPGVDVLS